MNWLQRNLPPRESWTWVFGIGITALMYVSAHFQAFQAAFDLAPKTEQRIELITGLAAMLLAKQSFSWMPSKEKQTQAIVQKEIDDILKREPPDPPRPTS